ncbi:hypothetical protein L581_1715 [Serratia fonticola AU-AP2C]|nr:hypothetical protein L581_1715 [Serratia fonticola AU-AP2C]
MPANDDAAYTKMFYGVLHHTHQIIILFFDHISNITMDK